MRLAGRTQETPPSQNYPIAYQVVKRHTAQLISTLGLDKRDPKSPKPKVVIYIENLTPSQTGQDRRYLGIKEEATENRSERRFDQMQELCRYETGILLGILEQVASEARNAGTNLWRR